MNLKLKMIGAGLTACLLVALAGGCSKEESGASGSSSGQAVQKPASQDAQKSVSNAVAATEKAVQSAATEVKATADAAKVAADKAAAEAQVYIDKAKDLVNGKKYPEALTELNKLANFKLTPEQQKMVDDLKVQAQKMMESDGMKAIGGALGGAQGGELNNKYLPRE